ncbi:MAG TPA: carbamoyltransferase HypF, partial [Pirellulales bacterium]
HYEAYRAFVADIELYERLFGVRPAVLAHDLHPDYGSTRYARQRAAAESLELIAVQHHHAHLASCLADNGLSEPAIGVTFDGAGYGLDGAIWGGEFLVGDYAGFRRAAHLRYVGMPGGEQAVREPWRMALAHLLDAGCEAGLLEPAVPPAQLRTAERMLERGLNCPATSSVGRLFDAVTALAGLRYRVSYEGQAAVELEWLASDAPAGEPYPYEIGSPDARIPPSPLVGEGPGVRGWGTLDSPSHPPLVIDTRPLVRALAADCQRGTPREAIARSLHETLADIICEVCTRLRTATGLNLIALSGGVFLNAVLTGRARERLEQRDFRVCTHARVPPGDGGLSFGQLAIAAYAWQQ